MKHTKQQIEEALAYWQNRLNAMNEAELDEGLIKKVAGGIKDATSSIAKGLKNGIGSIAIGLHDIALTNNGVKLLLDAIEKVKARHVDEANVRIGISIGKASNIFPITNFDVNSKKNNIICEIGLKAGNPPKPLPGVRSKTLADLRDMLDLNKIEKVARSIDAITVQAQDPTKDDPDYPIIDLNKVLDVKFNGTDTITIIFDESKKNLKKIEHNDKLFSK